jgi:hypothetical protein
MNTKSRTKPVEDAVVQGEMVGPLPYLPTNVDIPQNDVLQQFDRLRAALAQTHSEIPGLLAAEGTIGHELGLAEARGDSSDGLKAQLDETVRQRQAAIRRRSACADGILAMEPALQAERAAAEARRQEHATQVASEFRARYDSAIATLQRLWAEADLLSRTLRTQISTPLPVKVCTSIVTGIASAEPIRGDAVAELDATTERLGKHLDALDSALARVGAIRQSKQLDQYHYDLSQVRGTPAEFPGTYRVTAAFDCLVDGLKFEVGTLIDSSLVGPGSLQRLVATRRFIHPAEFGSIRAA